MNNIQRDEWINGEPFWLARCEYIEENLEEVIKEVEFFRKKHSVVVSKILKDIDGQDDTNAGTIQSALSDPTNTTWTYGVYNLFHLLQPSVSMWHIYNTIVELVRFAKPELDKFKDGEPIWFQSWCNYNMSEDIESELGWHDHQYPYHGYVQVDPKNTVTEFEDGTQIYNEIGQIYFGKGGSKHRVRKLEEYSGARITFGFDLAGDYGAIYSTLTSGMTRMSFLPMVL